MTGRNHVYPPLPSLSKNACFFGKSLRAVNLSIPDKVCATATPVTLLIRLQGAMETLALALARGQVPSRTPRSTASLEQLTR